MTSGFDNTQKDAWGFSVDLTDICEYLSSSAASKGNALAVPSADHLRKMIEAAFWTSLRPYEAQYFKFELTYFLSTDMPNGIYFDPPIMLSVESLRNLAPALVPSRTRLAVSASNHGTPADPLSIRALLPHPPERAVEVVAVAPGHVVVRWGSERLAIIRNSAESLIVPHPRYNRVEQQMFLRGEYPAGPTHALHPSHLAGLLGGLVPAHAEPSIVGCVLLMLAQEMRSHRRGGAVIVWSAGDENWEDSLKVANRLSRYRGLAEHVQRLAEEAANDPDHIAPDTNNYLVGRHSAVNAEFLEQLVTVGRLTAVDGALLLSDSLEVIGYGAKITAQPSENAPYPLVRRVPELISRWDWDPEEDGKAPLSQLGGTRHQSACHLVAKHNDAKVVVCSQDGPLSAISFNQAVRRVVVLRQLEAMLD